MKKFIIIFLALTIMSSPAVVLGDADTLNNDNNTIGDGSHVNGGPDLRFYVSPTVELSVYVTANDYAMTSASTFTGTDNGMEYGVASTSTGYAQRKKTTDADSGPETVTDVALPGNWNWMGGS